MNFEHVMECFFVVLMDGLKGMEQFFSVLLDRYEHVLECIFVVLKECLEDVMERIFVVLMDNVRFALLNFSVPMDVLWHLVKCIVVVPMDMYRCTKMNFLVLMDIWFDVLNSISGVLHRKAAAALRSQFSGGNSKAFEKSKRALFFSYLVKEQERKEEERKEGVMNPALVILQQKTEHEEKACDVQLEGYRVGNYMVNIMVQRLDGSHLIMKVTQGAQVSVSAFYLTRQSKILLSGDLLWMGTDERLVMHGRLRGGMEGDWTCQHCGRQWCWVSRTRCYRCGKSKCDPPTQQQADNGNAPGWIKTQARQQTGPGMGSGNEGELGLVWGRRGQPLGQRPPATTTGA